MLLQENMKSLKFWKDCEDIFVQYTTGNQNCWTDFDMKWPNHIYQPLRSGSIWHKVNF